MKKIFLLLPVLFFMTSAFADARLIPGINIDTPESSECSMSGGFWDDINSVCICDETQNLKTSLDYTKCETIIPINVCEESGGIGGIYQDIPCYCDEKKNLQINKKGTACICINDSYKWDNIRKECVLKSSDAFTEKNSFEEGNIEEKTSINEESNTFSQEKTVVSNVTINSESAKVSNIGNTEKVKKIVADLDQKAANFKRSDWKNEDGKFNTSRLISDSVAGVVLGTAGGLITSSVVKKSQVKSGFEDLNCAIGGQVVAGWGDEFLVGIQ